MALGYLGYAKLANIFLLTNSGGLNRMVNPILSEAVWGAGWYTGAKHTNYADNQQHFEGSLEFELQGIPSVWNLVGQWLIENRVQPQSMILSPNGIAVQNYLVNQSDNRTGVWLDSASFRIEPESAVTLTCNVKALKRQETYSASTYKTIRVGPGRPTGPLNPAPFNRNPFPGWSAFAQLNWPGSPPYFTDTNPFGFVLMGADMTFSNNLQIIRGCTGLTEPAAMIQGTMNLEGSVRLWRDGPIPDPYAQAGQPFTASGASLLMALGKVTPVPQLNVLHVLLTSDEFTIQGQDAPVPRVFGFAGLGDGTMPPLVMPPL